MPPAKKTGAAKKASKRANKAAAPPETQGDAGAAAEAPSFPPVESTPTPPTEGKRRRTKPYFSV